MKKKGFTLAEVLITLGIIGVVAAITLPTLMQDGSKQQLGTKLAKFANNTEKITRAAAVEDTLDRRTLWAILNEEMLFDNSTGLGATPAANAAAAASTKATLRDGTKVQITASTGTVYNQPDAGKYGGAIAQIEFWPEIPGLSGGPSSFLFVVTSNGFVFPDGTAGATNKKSGCLQKIYDNKYKATKVYGVDTFCKS